MNLVLRTYLLTKENKIIKEQLGINLSKENIPLLVSLSKINFGHMDDKQLECLVISSLYNNKSIKQSSI